LVGIDLAGRRGSRRGDGLGDGDGLGLGLGLGAVTPGTVAPGVAVLGAAVLGVAAPGVVALAVAVPGAVDLAEVVPGAGVPGAGLPGVLLEVVAVGAPLAVMLGVAEPVPPAENEGGLVDGDEADEQADTDTAASMARAAQPSTVPRARRRP
jgi:hypothetical protein